MVIIFAVFVRYPLFRPDTGHSILTKTEFEWHTQTILPEADTFVVFVQNHSSYFAAGKPTPAANTGPFEFNVLYGGQTFYLVFYAWNLPSLNVTITSSLLLQYPVPTTVTVNV